MISESIANASIHSALNPKDLGRKKRTNRSAKLKQCKLDARREQWLSQVKNKGCKDESNGGGGGNGIPVSAMHLDGKNLSPRNLVMRAIGEENDGGSIHHYSDTESSQSNSPISCISLLSSKSSAANYSGSTTSSSSSSGGSFSGNISDEEEDDDGCLDDWEAVADALAINENPQKPNSDNPAEKLPGVHSQRIPNRSVSVLDGIKRNHGITVPGASTGSRAWRPDDASRPPCLPTLSKQHSFPANSDRHYCRGSTQWAHNSVVVSAPLSCPICYEDLDTTDSSFHPCLCGFRLCLFCHKRILEEDGRCPGCRKPYQRNLVEGEPCPNQFTRSSSLVMRS